MELLVQSKYRCLKQPKQFLILQTISLSFFPFLFLIFITACFVPASQAQLRAAMVKVDISPLDSQYLVGYGERKSTGIHAVSTIALWPLMMVKLNFYLISSDICLFSTSEYDNVVGFFAGKHKSPGC